MDEANLRQRAQRRVKALRLFYMHLTVYILINVALTLINLLTSSNSLWFYWAWLGWGIAIVVHAISVFGLHGAWGQGWQHRKVEEIIENERR